MLKSGIVTIDPIKKEWYSRIGYNPHPGQSRLHFADWRFAVGVCGRRWGKSLGAAREIERVAIQPKTRSWIVAPTYDLTDKVFREVWQSMCVRSGMPIKRKSERERYIEFDWLGGRSIVEGKSADSPDSLLGEGLDFIVVDEAAKIKRKIWEQYLRPTLSDREGNALFISTPEGFNWFNDLYNRGQSSEFPHWWSLQSPTWDNPFISKDDIAEAKSTLSKPYFDQEFGAEFTSFAGKVYPFDRETHASRILQYEPGWNLSVSMDFGYRMPSVGWYQDGIVNGIPEIQLIDEISHKENIKTPELANMILQKNEEMGYNVQAYYGDPAGAGAQPQSGLGDIEAIKNATNNRIIVQYRTDQLSKDVATGVNHVRSYFEDAQGNAHFFVSKSCPGHIEDNENYRYPEKKQDQDLKNLPLKDGRHDHGTDDERYYFINRFPIRKEFIGILPR